MKIYDKISKCIKQMEVRLQNAKIGPSQPLLAGSKDPFII